MPMEIIDTLLANRQPTPGSLFGGPAAGNVPGVLRSRALYLLAGGAATFIALTPRAGIELAGLALIPFAIGAVKYKLWHESVARQKTQQRQEP